MIIKFPNMGDDFKDAVVVKWFVKEGQHIAEDEDMVELVTDKVSFVMPSPVSGRVKRIICKEGEQLGEDMILVEIDCEGEFE